MEIYMGVEKRHLTDLEIDAAEHCNLSCAHCTHNSGYFTSKDEQYSFESFQKDLNILKKFITVSAFRFVGGEPLLNKNIVHYAKFVKSINIAEHITLFTNGLLLHKAPDELFTTIDRLRISVYDIDDLKNKLIENNVKAIREKYPNLDVVSSTINSFLKFTTVEKHKDEKVLQEIYDNCYYSFAQHGLSMFNGRLYKCFATRKKYNFLKAHKEMVKDDFEYLKAKEYDSLEINEDLTLETLNAFIDKQGVLEGCKWCLGCSGKLEKQQQITDKNDYATLEDVDIEGGKSYLSNTLFGWSVGSKEHAILKDGKHFKSQYLKDFYSKYKFSSKQQ